MNLDKMTKSEVLEYVNNANTGFIKYNNIKLIDYEHLGKIDMPVAV